jgi:hypothetical protein
MFSMKPVAHSAFAAILLTGLLGMVPRAAAQASPAAPAASQPSASQSTPQASAPSATTPAPAAAVRPRSLYRRRTLDDRVKELAKALDLNETQQAGVKAVLERQQLRARNIQFDQTVEGSERIGRLRALQEDTVLRIRALLNDEQKKKYDPLNHAALPPPESSQKYVDQWMKTPQHK